LRKLNAEPSIGASRQVSVHLAKQFQRRRILEYGYRSHNFNIIPRELDSTGKKIETNTSLDSLKLHIVLDKSSDITTISSPLHKRMKPSDSPVHDIK
jgi:hypothetical protein